MKKDEAKLDQVFNLSISTRDLVMKSLLGFNNQLEKLKKEHAILIYAVKQINYTLNNEIENRIENQTRLTKVIDLNVIQ